MRYQIIEKLTRNKDKTGRPAQIFTNRLEWEFYSNPGTQENSKYPRQQWISGHRPPLRLPSSNLCHDYFALSVLNGALLHLVAATSSASRRRSWTGQGGSKGPRA